MSEKKPPEGGAPAEDLLASASRFLRDTFEELTQAYVSARDGVPTTEKELVARGNEFRKWASAAYDEKRKIDELHGKHSPGGGAAAIDFAAARAEIGRRLDRLRAAQGAGSIPE